MSDDQLDQPEPSQRDGHPILWGIVALVAVAAVVGGVVGGGALAATRVMGLGDDDTVNASATDEETLFLPPISDTEESTAPSITLSAEPQPSQPTKPDKTKEPEPEPDVSLSALQTEVGPMEHIDLTGVYQDGLGAILRVQQFEGGTWTDFPVTIAVRDVQFSTYIQTGLPGLNRFRVIDTDTGATSNEVKVEIG